MLRWIGECGHRLMPSGRSIGRGMRVLASGVVFALGAGLLQVLAVVSAPAYADEPAEGPRVFRTGA